MVDCATYWIKYRPVLQIAVILDHPVAVIGRGILRAGQEYGIGPRLRVQLPKLHNSYDPAVLLARLFLIGITERTQYRGYELASCWHRRGILVFPTAVPHCMLTAETMSCVSVTLSICLHWRVTSASNDLTSTPLPRPPGPVSAPTSVIRPWCV